MESYTQVLLYAMATPTRAAAPVRLRFGGILRAVCGFPSVTIYIDAGISTGGKIRRRDGGLMAA
jgi:hypothetical protein